MTTRYRCTESEARRTGSATTSQAISPSIRASCATNDRYPRLLVIDQPSQGHYPSDIAKRTGQAASDADEIAVSRLYQLLDTFAKQSNGRFQIIAVDHADIDTDWFQAAIVDRWRGENRKIIPEEWLEGL